jgi:prolyl-tRNA synthetase
VAAGQVMLARRTGGRKMPLPTEGLAHALRIEMDSLQQDLLEAARRRREEHTVRGVTKPEFIEFMARDGGLAYAGWCGDARCETEVKDQTKATIRCLPDEEFRSPVAPATCLWCGRKALAEAVWGKAY